MRYLIIIILVIACRGTKPEQVWTPSQEEASTWGDGDQRTPVIDSSQYNYDTIPEQEPVIDTAEGAALMALLTQYGITVDSMASLIRNRKAIYVPVPASPSQEYLDSLEKKWYEKMLQAQELESKYITSDQAKALDSLEECREHLAAAVRDKGIGRRAYIVVISLLLLSNLLWFLGMLRRIKKSKTSEYATNKKLPPV